MKAAILSIGDEILTGEIPDTNAAWLAERLFALGTEIDRHVTVGDVEAEIESALREAAARAHLVVTTGGLGPTEDDLTRHAVAKVAGAPLELHEPSLAHIEERFRRYDRTMPTRNRIQAMIPAGAIVLDNSEGTANGFVVRCGDAHIAALPGVPHEMRAMFENRLVAFIEGLPHKRHAVAVEKLKVFGLPESSVNERIRHLMTRGANPTVGLRVDGGVITVKFTATGSSVEEARKLIAPAREAAERQLGDTVFGHDETTIEQAVAQLLERHRLTVAVAESCTGGLIGHYLTEVPGISRFLLDDLVTYSNEAKVELLGVARETIEAVGAVSEEVAGQMAAGVRQRAAADIGLSTTGIAGPTGGSPQKPVGLVFVGLATEDWTRVERLKFVGSRTIVKERAAKAALDILRLHLKRIGDWSKKPENPSQ